MIGGRVFRRMNMNGHHEDLTRHEEVRLGSERSFGVAFAAVFSIVGLWPMIGGGGPSWLWLGAAGAAAFIGAAIPHWLAVPSRLWHRVGLILAKVVSPVALAIVYFGTVVPTGLLIRIAGKDPLRLRRDPSAHSYWIKRETPGPHPNRFDDQF